MSPSFSGLFDNEFNDGPHALQFNRPSARRNVSRIFRKHGMRPLRRLMLALTGSVPGGPAIVQRTRVQHLDGQDEFGGARATELVDVINRVTTSEDTTDIDSNVLLGPSAIDADSYPTDLSGNGGGGKAGF